MPHPRDHLSDIPIARRISSKKRRQLWRSWWLYPALVLLLVPIPLLAYQMWHSPKSINSIEPTPITPQVTEVKTATAPVPLYECRERPPKTGTCFNHLPYAEAPAYDLQTIAVASDGYRIQLRSSAARKFKEMQSAASKEGINLYAISGFRTIALQEGLFYGIAQQRGQDLATRARVSAPPGYSEHHTGYALDIGDANNPSTELNISFERTRAFQWLVRNAGSYGFELSFPRNEPQGVSYEPWHWRFVGDADSRAVFRR